MKILHLADLHLGKKLNNYSLIEDQKFVLDTSISLIKEKNIKAVLISGDVYDTSISNEEAITLFSYYLDKLIELGTKVLIIPGNHDSSIRLSFASSLLKKANVIIAKPYSGYIENYILDDEVNIYLLPNINPSIVRPFSKEPIKSYNDALKFALKDLKLDDTLPNILMAHQFVTGSEVSGSETLVVGGEENVDSSLFSSFTYVALGHIHKSQGNGKIRYPGSILKYSASEDEKDKSFTILDIKKDKSFSIEEVKIVPLRNIVKVEAKLEDLLKPPFSEDIKLKKSFLNIILTDQFHSPNVVPLLSTIYPNILSIRYKIDQERYSSLPITVEEEVKMDPYSLITSFIFASNQRDSLNQSEIDYLKEKINEAFR